MIPKCTVTGFWWIKQSGGDMDNIPVEQVHIHPAVNDIHGYLSADKDDPWRTMTEAAEELGVTNHVIRKLIKDGIPPACQMVEEAPTNSDN